MFILCVKIFFVRIIDVSLGTFRTIVLLKDKKLLATIIGFFEVLIWFLIVREALNTGVDNLLIAFSYALGFAFGTYIGALLTEKFIHYPINLQVITSNSLLADELRKKGFAVSIINIEGMEGKKKMLFVEITDTKYSKLIKTIKKFDKTAFIVVHETKVVHNGYMNIQK